MISGTTNSADNITEKKFFPKNSNLTRINADMSPITIAVLAL